jgi:hypothetical protein
MFVSGLVNLLEAMNTSVPKSRFPEIGKRSHISIIRVQHSKIIVDYFLVVTEKRLSALRPTPNLEDQVSAFMFPRNRMAQLHPQVSDSLSVAFYVSQGYIEISEESIYGSIVLLLQFLNAVHSR